MRIDIDKKSLRFLRKVDDIGRVTLPRQIRELYNINDGDTVEVYCDGNGQFVMKKHKLLEHALASSEKILEGFHNATGIPVILCDRNEIISIKGMDNISCFDLSDDFFAQIRRKDETVYPGICLNQDKTIVVKDFKFIIHNDEYVGAVIIPDEARDLNEADKMAFNVCIAAIDAYVC